MVIAAIVIWVMGMLTVLIAGFCLTIEEEPHDTVEFEKYYKSWGGTRFYTLWFIALIILAVIWSIALVTAWIIALIKGW
jgi:multisubunit Na+/H+ antiporter MnhB subunit